MGRQLDRADPREPVVPARTEAGPGPRAPVFVGAIDALGAALLYVVGWERAFSYDASRTVGRFVTAPSLDAVFRQDRFNNHPLFSFLEHLLHSATGSTDERLLRVLPILCGAVAVGLVAAAVARHLGSLAGHVAGATLALNPLALRQFREVRGYALVTLAAVVATLALLKRLRGGGPRTVALYVGAMAVAVTTHLFALALLAIHVFIVLGWRRPLHRWLWAWAVVVASALVVQWPAIVDGLRTPPKYRFAPTFPLRLAANLLGGFALPGLVVLVVIGWTVLRRARWVRWAAAGTAVAVAAPWLAGPSWLDSRFFIWLAPAAAVAAGVAVAAKPRLASLAAAGLAVQLFVFLPDAARSEVPNRIAAGLVRPAQATGKAVCALNRTRASLLGYADVPWVWEAGELPACEVAVEAAGPKPQVLLPAACERFAHVLVLPAKHPGAVFADQPLPLTPEFLAEAPRDARGWEPTAEAALCRR